MSHRRSRKLSTFGSRLTAIVSVTLVLVIVGTLGLIGILAENAANGIWSNMSVEVRLRNDATDADANALKRMLHTAPYVESYTFTPAAQVLEQELAYDPDVLEMLDTNPYTDEFSIHVRPRYTHADSLAAIRTVLRAVPCVDEVDCPDTIAHDVHSLLSYIFIGLGITAAILLIISIILIYNTVNLSIYSRRFVIHTMQLVGATPGFVSRPFVTSGCVNGLIAGVIASGVLAATVAWAQTLDPYVQQALPWWPQVAIVLVSVPVAGVLICGISSYFATRRYINAGQDKLYMQ